MDNNSNWRDYLILIPLIFVPRLLHLGRFLTVDEILFLTHAREFAAGLSTGDFSQTLGIGYPGVTVAWWSSGPVSLMTSELGAYLAGRMATAFATGVLLLLLFALSQRLIGRWAAFLGVGLLALDPYTLSYSRIFHISVPLALFMALAAVSFVLWLTEEKRYWLVGAGAFTGLALLTKSTALLLGPMLAVVGLVWLVMTRPAGAWKRLFIGGAAVAGIAALVFVVAWPAMWTQPLAALDLTFSKLITDQAAGTGNLGMYWRGQFVQDPGPVFYLVAFILKATPWLMLGMLVSVGLTYQREQRFVIVALWLFALTYLIIMTVASKKSIRYMLPMYPFFYLLAGIALTWVMQRARRPLTIGLFVLAIGWAIPYHPYYFTYFNPAVMGHWWATDTILVGWGEGLDEAARYLNEVHPNGHVTAWYRHVFREYYAGTVYDVVPQELMLSNEYTVLYVNQVQRNIPDPNLIHYFRTEREPEYTVRFNGIDYAWIYRNPPAESNDTP